MGRCSATVVVVDDDEDIRDAMADILESEGYAVVGLPDGPSALAYLRSEPAPCLVLLDWNMAPLNAADIMAEVARESTWVDIPFVLFTADARATDKMRTAPFIDVVRKPVDLPRFISLVARHCRQDSA